jgi:hypothetical protein
MYEPLTEDNYIRFAMKHYDNPLCKGVAEFEDDMARLVYLKRLFRRYRKTGVLRERLILNHIIVFCNVFGVEAGCRLLFHRIESDLHYILKTFLVYLGYLPEGQPKFRLEVDVLAIVMDMGIIQRLRGI